MKNANKIKMAAIIAATSLSASACQKNETIENSFEYTESSIIDQTDLEEIKEEEKYSISDLYILSRPRISGKIEYRFLILDKNLHRCGEDYEFYIDVLNFNKNIYWDKSNRILECRGEYWLPDCTKETITPLIEHPLIKDMYKKNDFLTKNDIISLKRNLEVTLNTELPKITYPDETYKIDKLILVNTEDTYTLYSLERSLVYFTIDGCPIFYCFDILDNRNCLEIILNETVEEFGYSIKFKENVENYLINSIDYSYVLSNLEKDKKVYTSWEDIKIGNMTGKVNILGTSLEQEKRGYITIKEAQELVENLNEKQVRSKKISN